jgi:hypothetical protein
MLCRIINSLGTYYWPLNRSFWWQTAQLSAFFQFAVSCYPIVLFQYISVIIRFYTRLIAVIRKDERLACIDICA